VSADSRRVRIAPVRARIGGVEYDVEPQVDELPAGAATVELRTAGERPSALGFPVPIPAVVARDADGNVLE
jgi:hypothetical protein